MNILLSLEQIIIFGQRMKMKENKMNITNKIIKIKNMEKFNEYQIKLGNNFLQ